ncbi:MAG: BatA domain-containing protein, partial [Pirellulales bacterium]|nr:BatA domain-containing protein [Pirellulales bacterium]
MDFLFSNLLYIGLPLMSLPILIHLINMMRHQRIEWAAMEFLLASQKKNRTWVLIKQLLLLLMRMAAVAGIAFMVAQPLLKDRLGRYFGGGRVHHIVLLDDSFSMADAWGNTTAFEEAKKTVK